MTAQPSPQELFDVWKKQMEDGARIWAQMMGTPGGATAAAAPDPLKLWRPFMEQATEAWAKQAAQGKAGGGISEAMADGKAMIDQWVAAWDKLLSQAMQSEAFAQAMGTHLNQWLSAQGPARKAAAEQTEGTLQALGLPSRTQVIGIARQLLEIDDRLEDLEAAVTALRERLEARPRDRGARRAPARGRSSTKVTTETK
ncbi:MAG: hypothetical protein FJW23_09530 [Acidimicrobiia bacterium]|nr:hypothetical protein [Acidimicrobiia bacterium]